MPVARTVLARSSRSGLIALSALALATSALTMWPARAPSGVRTARLSGSDRYGTAATVATAKFTGGVDTVIMASGANFPDALAGAFLAGQSGPAGILLTAPDQLPQA